MTSRTCFCAAACAALAAMAGVALGDSSDDAVRVVRRLAERDETALFYSHNIVPAEKHAANDISFAELEFLLKTVRKAGVRV